MSESVTFQLDGDAAKLLAALSDSESGFRGLADVIKAAVGGAIPDLTKLSASTEQLASRDAFEQADRYAAAVERIGGAAKLTEPELARVNEVLSAAVERYAALGTDAPESLLKLQAQVENARANIDQFGTSATTSTDEAAKAFDGLLASLTSVQQASTLDELTKAVQQTADEIERLGGIETLTADQQQGLAEGVTFLAGRYETLGQDVPDALSEVLQALDGLGTEQTVVGQSADDMATALGSAASAATDTATAASQLSNSLDSVDTSAVTTADAIGTVEAAAQATGNALDETATSGETLDQALRAIDGAKAGATLREVQHAADDVKDASDRAGKSITEMFLAMAAGSAAGQIAVKALGELRDAAADLLTAVPKMVKETAEFGDHLRDLSNQTGVSVESLSLLNYVGQTTGVSLETLARTIVELGKNLADTGDKAQGTKNALITMGLSFDDLKKQKPEDAFALIFQQLGTLETGLRNELGTQIFGGKFRLMANLAKEDVAGLMKQAQALNLTFSTDSANASDRFNDALKTLNMTVTATEHGLGGMLLGPIADLVEQLPLLGGGFLLAGKVAYESAGKVAELSTSLVLVATNWDKIGPLLTKGIGLIKDSTFVTGLQTAANWALSTSIGGIATAVGGLTLVLAPYLLAIAAATTAATIFYNIYKLHTEDAERAAAKIKDEAAATANLARLNLELGEVYTTLADAIAEVNKRRAAVVADDGYVRLRDRVNEATAAVQRLTQAQKDDVIQASRGGLMKPDEIKAVTGLKPEVIAEINRERELTEAQNAAEAKLAADRIARGKTGLAAALANQKAQQDAELATIAATKDLQPDQRQQKFTEAVKRGESDRATIIYNAEKANADQVRALQSEAIQQRIKDEKEGVQATLATIAERERAEIEAAKKSGSGNETAEINAARVKAAIATAEALSGARKEGDKRDIALASETAQTQIRIEKDGLQQQLALIAQNTTDQIAEAERAGMLDAQLVAERVRIQQEGANKEAEVRSTARKQGEARDLELTASTEETRIKIQEDGLRQQLDLIDTATNKKLADAKRAGMLDQQLADESVRIVTEGENQKAEIRGAIAKKSRADLIALEQDRITREIELTKFGVDRDIALETQRYDEEVRLATIAGEDLDVLAQKHADRLAKIRQDGDEITIAGTNTAILAANRELAAMEANGATYAALNDQRQKINQLQIKGAQDLAAANQLRYRQERQQLLDLITDEKQSAQARMEARKQLIDLDAKNANTDKQARAIRAKAEMDLYRDMKVAGSGWSDQAIADQHRVALEAKAAAEGVKQDWITAFSGLADGFSKLGSLGGSTFGSIATGAGQAAQSFSAMARFQGKDAVTKFGEADTTGGKAAAVVGGISAGIGGIGEMASATDVKGAGNRMLGGAISGAKTGMMIAGPYGAAAGAVIGVIVGAMRHPDFEKAFNDVGKRYGVEISDGLSRQIADDAKDPKKKLGGSQLASELTHMGDIIKEAGGLTDKNFDKFTSNIRDTFVLVQQGQLAGDQAVKILDDNFGAFADFVVKSGKVASAGFTELLKLNGQAKEQSKEMIGFVTTQAAVASSAIAAMIAPIAKASQELADLKKSRDDVAKTRLADLQSGKIDDTRPSAQYLKEDSDLTAANIALHSKRVEVIGDEATKQVEALEKEKDLLVDLQFQRDQLATAGKSTTDLDAQIALVTAKIDALGKAGAATFPSIDRAGRLLAATFNTARANGVGLLEAVDAMGPGLDTLLKTYDNLGISIEGSAVAELATFRDRINNNRELVASADAVNQVMLSMSNIGALDANTFKDLEDQGVDTFKKLEAAGFSDNESLTMMKGFLENVRDAHEKLKLPIEENTQALLDQADAQGVLSKKAVSTNDVLMEGFGAIIDAVGGKLPEAFQKFRDAAVAKTQEAADAAKAASEKAAADAAAAVQLEADKVAEAAAQMARDAATAALAAGEALRDNVTGAVIEVGTNLDDIDWKQWAKDGYTAGQLAKTGLKDTAGAAGNVDKQLADIDWDRFAKDAEEAARRAKEAIDGVSFGTSPGGIKEIPLQLALAMRAAKDFATLFGSQMAAAKDTADALGDSSLIDLHANVAHLPTMVHDVVHTVSRDTTRESSLAAQQQDTFDSMFEKMQHIAEKPTTIVQAGAVTTTLQAWGIAERQDIERAMAKATLSQIVKNSEGLFGQFQHIVKRSTR